jgi:choline dehydrogenase
MIECAELTKSEVLAGFPADWPEIQYLSLPTFAGNLENSPAPTDGFNYAQIFATLMTPTSRGNITITSSKMSDHPLINPNWLTTQSDIEVSIAMFKRLRQVWTVPAFVSNLTIGDEFYPGPSVETDAEIEAHIRANMASVCHATSTCKMGKADDPLAVVDSHGKVYGVKNRESLQVLQIHKRSSYGILMTNSVVRIVDGSIFPFLTPGQAPQAAVCT